MEAGSIAVTGDHGSVMSVPFMLVFGEERHEDKL